MAEQTTQEEQTTQDTLETKIATQAGAVDGVDPTLPAGTKVETTKIVPGADEFVTAPDPLDTTKKVDVETASTEGIEVTMPDPYAAPTIEAAKVSGLTPAMEAEQGKLSLESIIEAPQGTVSSQAVAIAAQADLDQRATVQFQLGQLMESLEDGKPLPPWAAPQARAVNAIMQKRGLGSSSMASAAMMQSLMESGVQIAAADADKYATIQLANLNNRQQAALQNAATYAAMDTANLNARLTAAVNNAKAFLSLDLQNLDNRQKTATLNFNAELQAAFTDVAMENAVRQINAKNQMQVDQFFTELGVQVDTANVNRVSAMNQFNVSQSNAMAQYNATLSDQREKFNLSMQTQIEQSNAVWRREINTANTATANETARLNAQNLLALTMTAQSQLWQQYRDEAAWAFSMSESELNRAHEIGMLAMQGDINSAAYDKQFKDKVGVALGEAALNIIFRPKRSSRQVSSFQFTDQGLE